MNGAQTRNDSLTEGQICRRAPTLFVEFSGDLGVGASLQQSVDFSEDLRFGLTQLPGCGRRRQVENFGGAALETYLHANDGVVSHQGNVFQYKSSHALAVAVASERIVPQPGEVFC